MCKRSCMLVRVRNLWGVTEASDSVEINERNFPDPVFHQYVLERINIMKVALAAIRASKVLWVLNTSRDFKT